MNINLALRNGKKSTVCTMFNIAPVLQSLKKKQHSNVQFLEVLNNCWAIRQK